MFLQYGAGRENAFGPSIGHRLAWNTARKAPLQNGRVCNVDLEVWGKGRAMGLSVVDDDTPGPNIAIVTPNV